MTQHYYKSAVPAVVAAVQKFAQDKKALQDAANEFAAEFGGTAVMGSSLHGVSFAGVRFRPQKATDLFTAADERSGYVQKPRDRLKTPIDKALKEPHAQLKKAWQTKHSELFPGGTSVSSDEQHKAIGFDWGIALFSGGQYLVFEHNGTVYATCAQKLKDCMTEITGGEFEQALAAANEAAQENQA